MRAGHRLVAGIMAMIFGLAGWWGRDLPADQAWGVPSIDRASLDVPFVPTPLSVVNEMLKLADLDESDVLYDLGSGDGRIVITAATRYGVRGVGIDLDPQRIMESRANAQLAGVEDRVRFIQGDLFEADLSEATAVTLYLLSSINERLRPKLLRELRPGTPVVSHSFSMGDWEPDKSITVEGRDVYLWIIPAQADGAWALNVDAPGGDQEFLLTLEQEYQKVDGTALIDGQQVPVQDGQLLGDTLRFFVTRSIDSRDVTQAFVGRVNGDRIQGFVNELNRGGGRGTWTAQRTAAAAGVRYE